MALRLCSNANHEDPTRGGGAVGKDAIANGGLVARVIARDDPANSDGRASQSTTAAECLDYFADMVAELMEMAHRANFFTLERQLALAHQQVVEDRLLLEQAHRCSGA
jgi:hypothetical protein